MKTRRSEACFGSRREGDAAYDGGTTKDALSQRELTQGYDHYPAKDK